MSYGAFRRMFPLAAVLLAGSVIGFAQGGPAIFNTADGGTRQTLESIFVPPLAHAPFTLTLETEWTRPLGSGGTYTLVNKRHIMRDSAGRIYEERWYLVPKGGKEESSMSHIQVADPGEHTLYNCQVALKRCFLVPYGGSTKTVYRPTIQASGSLPDGTGIHVHEELGTSDVLGVLTNGYRETTTMNPGVFGNDQPMVTSREFWYSTQLGIDLISKVDSPQAGKQTFTVTEINTDEPAPQNFAVPEGYTVVDRREVSAPNN